MLAEIGAKAALEWIIERLKRGILDPAISAQFESKIASLQAVIDENEASRSAIEKAFSALSSDDRGLWGCFEPLPPFPDYNDRVSRRPVAGTSKLRPVIITTVNYKGGVGKTTTTANLAAYFDKTLKKRVLIIDLDYQGSMTTALRELSGLQNPEYLSTSLLAIDDPASAIARCAVPLGHKLPLSYLVPSFYPLARVEERLMVEWLLQKATSDVRYRLARMLLDDFLGTRFDVVLIDAAPRLSTATINALAASSYVLVPAVMNPLSAEPVANFLSETQKIMNLLNPRLSFLGVVETMAPPGQEGYIVRAAELAKLDELLPRSAPGVRRLSSVIARKAALATGRVAYLEDVDVRTMFDGLGDEIVLKIGGLP